MLSNLELKVGPDSAGMRLDRFLVERIPATNRSLCVEAIGDGRVHVNRRPAVKGARLNDGDVITVKDLMEVRDVRVIPNPAVFLQIIYEDESLLALDKPAGIPVHPVHHTETDTLANGLIARYPQLANIGENPLFPALVHRIDGDTSGLVLAAKDVKTYEALRRQFGEREVVKTYVALVHGRLDQSVRLEHRLMHDPGRRGRMRVVDGTIETSEQVFRAVSEVRPCRQWKTVTMVEVEIRTGVTHQIRCQLAHAGHPLVGDRLYGVGMGDPGFRAKHHFLHAARIRFIHPQTGRIQTLAAPLPGDWEKALQVLGQPRNVRKP